MLVHLERNLAKRLAPVDMEQRSGRPAQPPNRREIRDGAHLIVDRHDRDERPAWSA